MSAQIINGFEIAKEIRLDIALKVKDLEKKNCTPCLAVVLVGENPASISYVRAKSKALIECGMIDRSLHLSDKTTQDELLSVLDSLNEDDSIHGILVQLPLPSHIDENRIIDAIHPNKDVDGFTPINVGNMVLEKSCYLPCTPHGILVLLEKMAIDTKGKSVCVLGRSNIVGKPISLLLSQKKYNATVTLCHSATKNVKQICRNSDIVIAAVGKPNFVIGSMIKPGATVIDVGVNRVIDEQKKKGYRLCGDVDFESVKEKASFITPVPKGVGPMTIAMLMQNTLLAAQRTI